MPNTAKQTAIRKAWGELYEKVEKHLTKDGYVPFQITEMKVILYENEDLFETTDKIGFNGESIGTELFRPKSLQGIENNNEWIRIESEEDLPKQSGDYWVYETRGSIDIRFYLPFSKTWGTHEMEIESPKVSHYQPIVKPEKPIY